MQSLIHIRFHVGGVVVMSKLDADQFAIWLPPSEKQLQIMFVSQDQCVFATFKLINWPEELFQELIDEVGNWGSNTSNSADAQRLQKHLFEMLTWGSDQY